MPARLALFALLVSVSACQDEAPPPTPAAERTAEAPAIAAPVVPAAQLAALLPSQVGDLARGDVAAEQDSAMGLSVSRVQATYGTGPQAVTLLVLDVGSAEGAALMGLAVPPTGRLDGRPVRRSETPTKAAVQVSVGGRYFVEASGARVGLDLLDVFVRTVDLSALPGGA